MGIGFVLFYLIVDCDFGGEVYGEWEEFRCKGVKRWGMVVVVMGWRGIVEYFKFGCCSVGINLCVKLFIVR